MRAAGRSTVSRVGALSSELATRLAAAKPEDVDVEIEAGMARLLAVHWWSVLQKISHMCGSVAMKKTLRDAEARCRYLLLAVNIAILYPQA